MINKNIPQLDQKQKTIKHINDYGPLLAFFVTYILTDLITATAALMGATLIGITLSLIFVGKIQLMPLITAIIVGIFGGLTLWLKDPTFIKIKPTIIQLIMSAILFGGLYFKKSLLKPLLGQFWPMHDKGWKILTYRFAIFFAVMGILNEVVWRTQSTDFWVNFKVFGIMAFTFVFICTQIPMIEKNLIPEKNDQKKQ